jgi:serine protease Do
MHEKQKLFSLAAIVVAAVLFGMVLGGGLDLTRPADADRPVEAPQQATAVRAESPSLSLPDFASLADRVVPSVVSVFSTDVEQPDERRRRMPSDPFHFFFGPRDRNDSDEPTVRRSSGSGFFISAAGELLTNNHVVEDADRIEIELASETRYEVEVVGRDPETDLALLKVIDPDREFQALSLGNAEEARVGEWVMAVGNPLNMDHTVTVGVISAKGRVLGLSDSSFEDFIQTDAAINFGNSGGPLVNLRGEVIGINTAINAQGQNLGFAVPVSLAKRILPQLRERGRVVRGYLGIMVRNIDQDLQEAFGLASRDGAFVEEVLPKHAAANAGLEHGDVVTKVGDLKVVDTRDLIDTVSAMAPGAKVELEIVRDGKRKTVTVELEERVREGDNAQMEDEDDGKTDATERVGVVVSELSSKVRQMFGLDDTVEGVVITRVRTVSPAGEEGLGRGDVILEANGDPVRTVDDLVAAVDAVPEGGYLRLYVYRSRVDRSFFAILRLDR